MAAYNFFEGCECSQEHREISDTIPDGVIQRGRQAAYDKPTSVDHRRHYWRAIMVEAGHVEGKKLMHYNAFRHYIHALDQHRIEIPRFGYTMRQSLAEWVLMHYDFFRIDGEPETVDALIQSFQQERMP